MLQDEERAIFIGFDREEMIMNEAQRLGLLKPKAAKTPQEEDLRRERRKEQESYLHKRIIEAEAKRPFRVRRHTKVTV